MARERGLRILGACCIAAGGSVVVTVFEGEPYTLWFTGFAPANDPKYVVAVVIQRPTRISEFGGVIAGPVFSDLMRYALQQEGIAPATTPPTQIDIEYDPEEPVPGQEGVTLGDLAIKDERTDG